MLDQNTTALLAATIGGLLTIAGGLATNFYLLSKSANSEKRKELRNTLENLYKASFKIGLSYTKIAGDPKSAKDEVLSIEENRFEMSVLVNLYLPSLRSKFDHYFDEITNTLDIILEFNQGGIDMENYLKRLSKFFEENQNFRREIELQVKKKGYSYS